MMDSIVSLHPAEPPAADTTERRDRLLADITSLERLMAERAAALDEPGAFPQADFQALAACGALTAPFGVRDGGLGLGTHKQAALTLAAVLRALGRGNLAIGRLYEGHVNAIRLLCLYGSADLVARAAADAAGGHLFGLWVTDPPHGALEVDAGGRLSGGKAFCSGAGHAGRAVVTVRDDHGDTLLAYVSTAEAAPRKLPASLAGMRAACTGAMSFDHCRLGPGDFIGRTGDYLREPDFSGGAWRTSAVASGGLTGLVECAMRHLSARGRAGDPHQQARMGRAWIEAETAQLWVTRAALVAEGAVAGVATKDVVATVNLARIAVEQACMKAMILVERSLGLSAMMQGSAIERIMRDLRTYLRQPAPDEVLTEAAAHVIAELGAEG